MKKVSCAILIVTMILGLNLPVAGKQSTETPLNVSSAATWEDDGNIRYRITLENTSDYELNNIMINVNHPGKGEFEVNSTLETVKIDRYKRNIRLSIENLLPDTLYMMEYLVKVRVNQPDQVKDTRVSVQWINSIDKSKGTINQSVAIDSFAGGENKAIGLYEREKNYPLYPPHGKDLGVLHGSWYDMGVQYGERAGELTKWYFDHRFSEHIKTYGISHVIEDTHRYESEAKKFFPQALEFARGISDGAKPWLDQSKYATQLTHYDKIIFLNNDNCLLFGHPGPEAHGTANNNNNNNTTNSYCDFVEEERYKDSCSAFVALGNRGATLNGKTIVAHNNDGDFNKEMYRLTYIAIPDDPQANAFWSTTAPGKFFEIMGVNSKGVAVAVTAGGYKTWVPEEGIFERDFGVTWQYVLLRQMAYANNCREAAELVTIGTPEYRKITNRKTLLRTRHNNWVISDQEEACVVEATAHRYAIRYPGDFGEEQGYIVATNHFLCDYSYDENNVRSDFPMTKFGGEELTKNSTDRYYTLYWLCRNNYGSINANMAKEFLGSHFIISKEGERMDYVWDHGWVPTFLGARSVCGHSGNPESYSGVTVDPKVAVLQDKIVHFAVGRPCEWEGMWRTFMIPGKQ